MPRHAWVLVLFVAGCSNVRPVVCYCDGAVPGGDLSTGCGTTQCVGGVLYGCDEARRAFVAAETCDGTPPPNPRPPGTPDVLVFAVSGHCNPLRCGTSPNDEYLESGGAIAALTQPLLDSGLTVETYTATDNFYDVASTGDHGFLSLLDEMEYARDFLVADWDDPTRVIVVGHSHGAVWAHLALHVLEQRGRPIPVDVLVDLDGVSAYWEDKVGVTGFGDGWGPIIQSHADRTGTVWPFPIWAPTDQFVIPGRSEFFDIEEIVPDSTLHNLEVWSSDGVELADSQHNLRLDGGEAAIRFFHASENHENTAVPGYSAVAWATGEIAAIFGL